MKYIHQHLATVSSLALLVYSSCSVVGDAIINVQIRLCGFSTASLRILRCERTAGTRVPRVRGSQWNWTKTIRAPHRPPYSRPPATHYQSIMANGYHDNPLTILWIQKRISDFLYFCIILYKTHIWTTAIHYQPKKTMTYLEHGFWIRWLLI